MSTRSISVNVDINDFDDADILAAAESIMASGSRVALLGPETPLEAMTRLIADLAASIVRGDHREALRCLDDLVGDNRRCREAIDIGRLRVR